MILRMKTLFIECHYAKCHYAECHVSFIVMLNVVMLNVVAQPKALYEAEYLKFLCQYNAAE